MAIIINPDGTVSTIETTYDRYGNLRPKVGNPDDVETSKWTTVSKFTTDSNKVETQKTQHKFYPTEYAKTSKSEAKTPAPNPKKKEKRLVVRKEPFFVSAKEIDFFFEKKKESEYTFTKLEFDNLYKLVPNSLQYYFKKKYNEYVTYCNLKKPLPRRVRDKLWDKVQAAKKAAKSSKEKMKKAAKRIAKEERNAEKSAKKKYVVKDVSSTRNTIGDIAAISSLKSAVTNGSDDNERKEILRKLRAPILDRAVANLQKMKKKKNKKRHSTNLDVESPYNDCDSPIVNIASSQDFDVRTSNPPRPARAPKYAYARDRYGRVQERDSFNEDKGNEFYQAQNQQSNYDYSSYDANDDHDGAYSGWE